MICIIIGPRNGEQAIAADALRVLVLVVHGPLLSRWSKNTTTTIPALVLF
jgi:hypothetical protein